MMTISVSKSVSRSESYFEKELSVGDYYTSERQILGQWQGKGAAELGLKGEVSQDEWKALLRNQKPESDERLTARTKEGRRVTYDFTFSAPKSVSIAALVLDRNDVSDAHDKAVKTATGELERLVAVRRKEKTAIEAGNGGRVVTGNMIAGVFRHDTSRALDPQLHHHVVVLNASKDGDKWKAADMREVWRHRGFIQEVYRNELAKNLKDKGYEIEKTKEAFEIKGISKGVISEYSQRHREIIDRSKRMGHDTAQGRSYVAATFRRAKMKEANSSNLKKAWLNRLDSSGIKIKQAGVQKKPEGVRINSPRLSRSSLEMLLREKPGAYSIQEAKNLRASLQQKPFSVQCKAMRGGVQLQKHLESKGHKVIPRAERLTPTLLAEHAKRKDVILLFGSEKKLNKLARHILNLKGISTNPSRSMLGITGDRQAVKPLDVGHRIAHKSIVSTLTKEKESISYGTTRIATEQISPKVKR